MDKLNPPQKVLNLPAGYFGMVLGIIGMGFAWRYASTLWPVTRWPGYVLVFADGGLYHPRDPFPAQRAGRDEASGDE